MRRRMKAKKRTEKWETEKGRQSKEQRNKETEKVGWKREKGKKPKTSPGVGPPHFPRRAFPADEPAISGCLENYGAPA